MASYLSVVEVIFLRRSLRGVFYDEAPNRHTDTQVASRDAVNPVLEAVDPRTGHRFYQSKRGHTMYICSECIISIVCLHRMVMMLMMFIKGGGDSLMLVNYV